MEKAPKPEATVYEENRGHKSLFIGPNVEYTVKDENNNTIKTTGDKEEAWKTASDYNKKHR